MVSQRLNCDPLQHHDAVEPSNKTVHCCYNMQDDLSAQLIETAEKAADLDPRVLEAYIHQCTAEAQEGTLFCSVWFIWNRVMSISVVVQPD